MSLRVTLIQGGGSGYDQAPAVQQVLAAAGVDIEWDEHLAGWASMEKGGDPLPVAMLGSIRQSAIGLKTKLLPAPGGEKSGKRPNNYNVEMRKALGLFAAVRPLKNLPGLPARFQGIDMIVIREITEDMYTAIEHEIVPGVVQSIKIVTKAATERFLKFAFDYAKKAGRKTITCVHKANILKLADGLFLRAFQQFAEQYKDDLTSRDLIVDNTCMQMVSRPERFDVLVMGNLYGDIVSDLAAGIVGGISATHGINYGESICIYESFHGGSREAVPEGRANPLPLLLPALDLVADHGQAEAARRIHAAVGEVLTKRVTLTPDLGGRATTAEMARAVIDALE